MAEHLGIMGDEVRKAENAKQVAMDPTLMLCDYCDGTGNEFYAMYRTCPICLGVGVVDAVPDGVGGSD
jgi:DnaJ-class molecular chaperone